MIVSILQKKTIKLLKIICLLIMVGILCILPENHIYAAETADTITDGRLNDELTGTTNERTNINEPGTAESADDLKRLNVANTVTVTYDNGNGTLSGPLRILITLTLIAIAPVLIICLTSFTRIIIVLHFTRNALNTQTSPPNQVLLGLALFLTFFIMSPTIAQVRTEAIEPFDKG